MKRKASWENEPFPFEEYFVSAHGKAVFHFPISSNFCLSLIEGEVFLAEDALYRLEKRKGEVLERCFPLEKIEEARFYGYTGIAVCEIRVEGLWLEFCRSRGKDKKNISQLVRIVNEIADGSLQAKDAVFVPKSSTCPRCHRPYAPGSQVCHHCDSKKRFSGRLLAMVRPQLLGILLSMILFGATTLFNLVIPMIQRNLVDGFLQNSDIEYAVSHISSMVLVVLSMALVRVLIVIFSVCRNNLLSRVSNKTVVKMRGDIYRHIQTLSVAGISRHTAGDLISRVSRDTEEISNFLTHQLPNILEQVLTLLFVGTMLFSTDWRLAIFILLPMPFVAILFRVIWRRTQKLYRRQWFESANADTTLHDIFQGVRVVKVYGTEKSEIAKYDKVIANLRDVSVRSEYVWSSLMPYANFLMQVGNFILLYYAGTHILEGQMTIGELTMFTSYVSLIYSPLRWMARVPRMLQRTMTSVSKVFEVLDEEPDVSDAENAREMTIRGEIEIDSIYFGYDENENVLENVSVSIHPGEMLGIVGRSGVGKSTLINLVMRLYDVNKGAIRIDGVDVRDIAQHSLRSQIGVVLQETFLFSGTVYENLVYAKPDATYEEVIRAAKLANAHSFIMKLPDGYHTVVGEKGYTLSGGERQRVAIARAVLHDPKILILDEATSALDTETEKLVQDALAKLCQNRTTIAIAHRLSTLRNATKLLVLDKKSVAEIGTHEELLKQGGIYHDLVMAQRQMSAIKKTKKNPDSL